MTHEELEELGCDCGSTMGRTRGSGWLCPECGAQFSITGRSLKDLSRLYLDEPCRDSSGNYPPISDPILNFDWSELDRIFLELGYDYREAYRSLDLPSDD